MNKLKEELIIMSSLKTRNHYITKTGAIKILSHSRKNLSSNSAHDIKGILILKINSIKYIDVIVNLRIHYS